jgi:membrane protease YdiL (CAAX protease family)
MKLFSLNLNNQDNSKSIILITGILLSVLLPLGIAIGARYLNIGYIDKLVCSEFGKWATVIFLFFYAYRIERQPLLLWEGNDSGAGFTLLSILVLYVVYIFIAVVSAIPSWLGYRETDQLMHIIMQLLKGHPLLIFFISITAGVTEELIFRAYILTRLSSFFKKPYMPVILSSAVFSALHYRYHSLGEFIFTFLFGGICSVYYIKYRNIHALILTHFFIDFIVFTAAQHYY